MTGNGIRSLGLGFWAMLSVTVAGCSTAPTDQAEPEVPVPYTFWQPAGDTAQPRPWAIIIPGGGGMEVFGDTEHYFRWADWLNDRGIDVLLVDHATASTELPQGENERPDFWQARIVGHAVAAYRENGWLDPQCPGVAMGWSFGGAGALELAAGGPDVLAGLVGAVGFYPLVAFQPDGYAPKVPVLVLQGDVDDTTTPQALANLAENAAGEPITVELYVDGEHAFDVAGLTEPVEWNGGTFLHNAEAAAAAADRLERQLDDWGVGSGGCTTQ
ncbi:dienelactone hydrolase family protein [Aurantiacibacter sp. MUD11]|uniref:dienelactone hydrolase family protein n=1 Tax=Aurantiacibacter sp. MUD11 TaxID=3003265 RepID=UPI0022AAF893|nr:dienelactone hydrolase family protein [Aurantiacibacter sp. MUD11]WAT17306.1 dienelactone hydrolase family protein [Aurantiacibacter sp. MUD11]